MKTTRLMALATMPIALGLLACEVDDADDDLDMGADSAELTAAEMAPPAMFTFMAVENPGYRGGVLVQPQPGDELDETLVTVTLYAPKDLLDEDEMEFVGVIYGGTCDNLGPVVEELDGMETEENARMVSTTEVGLPLLAMNDELVVAVHRQLDDDMGPVVACTPITAPPVGMQ